MPDLAAVLYRADRLLALILTGKAGADAARELVQVLEELDAIAATSGQQEKR